VTQNRDRDHNSEAACFTATDDRKQSLNRSKGLSDAELGSFGQNLSIREENENVADQNMSTSSAQAPGFSVLARAPVTHMSFVAVRALT
jgi:hypothetical protein